MKQTFLFLLLSFLLWQYGFAQTLKTSGKDAVIQELLSTREDTNKVLLLIKLGNTLEQNQPDSASYYYTLAGNLSKKLNYLRGTFKFISNITAVLNIQNKFDSSLTLNLQSIEIAQKLKDERYLAIAYNNTGGSYYNIKDFEKCIIYFLKAATIFDKQKDELSLGLLYANLSGIYADMNLNDLSYTYGLKAIKAGQVIQDTAILKEGLNNTSSALLGLKKYDSALVLSNQSINLSKLTNDNWTLTACLLDNCQIYYHTQRYSELLPAANDALSAATIINNAEGKAKANLFKSLYYLNEKNYIQGKTFAEEGIAIATNNQIKDALQDGYNNLSLAEFGLGNMVSFHKYEALSDSVGEIILSGKIIRNTQELEAKYSLSEKQTEIDDLAKEKTIQQLALAQRKQTITWLISLLLIIITIAILNYRYQQQKKKLLQAEKNSTAAKNN